MNPDPRLFLGARRPHGQDDADPAIANALHQCKGDPKLTDWAECEKRQDAELCKKLRGVEPPPGLRDRIIAGAQVQRGGWRGWFEKRVWRSFRNSELVAVAAIVLLLGSAVFFRTTNPTEDGLTWQEAAVTDVAAIEQDGSTGPLDHVVNDLPQIRSWLAAQTCPSPATLPPQVRKLPIFGCAKRSWRGQPLSIVCFDFENGREVHLVTINRENLPDAPPAGAPVFGELRGYQTASWSEGPVAMMLIGKVQRSELEALFHSTAAAMLRSNRALIALR
jgi:hypothetical protein